jgi:hypothetical protein
MSNGAGAYENAIKKNVYPLKQGLRNSRRALRIQIDAMRPSLKEEWKRLRKRKGNYAISEG